MPANYKLTFMRKFPEREEFVSVGDLEKSKLHEKMLARIFQQSSQSSLLEQVKGHRSVCPTVRHASPNTMLLVWYFITCLQRLLSGVVYRSIGTVLNTLIVSGHRVSVLVSSASHFSYLIFLTFTVLTLSSQIQINTLYYINTYINKNI